MIKTNIDTVEKTVQFDYPILLKSKSDSKIVLAYQSTFEGKTFTGVVVATSDNNGIGEWSDCWQISAFDVFSGEITIKQ